MQHNQRLLWAGMILGALVSLGWFAAAEGSGIDSAVRMMPYQGYLDLDGVAFEGTIDVRVTLASSVGETWSEEHEDVALSAGRFGLTLGLPSEGLPSWFFEAEDAFLQLAVREGGSDDMYVSLGGNQPIHAAPATYWSAEGYDFEVRDDLIAQGSLTVTGELSAESVDMGAPQNLESLVMTGSKLAIGDDENAGEFLVEASGGGEVLRLQTPGGDADSVTIKLGSREVLTLEASSVAFEGDVTMANDTGVTVQSSFVNVNHQEGASLLTAGTVRDIEGFDGTQVIQNVEDTTMCILRSTFATKNGVDECQIREAVTNISACRGDCYVLYSEESTNNIYSCKAGCATW